MKFSIFDTNADLDEFRESVWVPWHAARSAQLAAEYPERGHYAGGPLDWAKPRAFRARPGHPAGDVPARAGGLVWATTSVPKMHMCLPHIDGGGGGVLVVHPECEQILAVYGGRGVSVPERSELKAAADLRGTLDPSDALTAEDTIIRKAERQRVGIKRARLLLGHAIDGVTLQASRAIVIDGTTQVRRDLSGRAADTVLEFEERIAAGPSRPVAVRG